MAKLVVLLAIALLAISMADSGYKVRISSLKASDTNTTNLHITLPSPFYNVNKYACS